VSIVTPSYNQGQFLEETIRSVLLQSHPDVEYIILDGGSTDGSLETIRKYEPWLAYWVSEADRGQSHAINKGFDRCTGQLVTFLASDDMYLPGTFADVARRAHEQPDCGVVVGGFHYMDGKSRLDATYHPPKAPCDGPVDLTLGPPGAYRLHQVATFFVAEALDRVGRWVRDDLKYTMDRELLFRICRRHKVLLADRAYAAFRKHDDSKSVSEILPFADEFARCYLMFRSGDKIENRLRARMARYHRAGGYVKYAKATDDCWAASASLLVALRHRPSYIWHRGYWARWAETYGVKSRIQALLRRKESFQS